MRCSAHDLACGPDGRCVLCRKEGVSARVSKAPAPPAAPTATMPRRATWPLVLGALVSAGAAAAATVLATSEHASPPDSPPTIQLGFPGAAPPVVTALAPTAAPPPPPAGAAGADDPQTAWLQRVAQGGQAPSAPAAANTTNAPTQVPTTAPAPPPAPLSLQEASRAVHVVVYTTGWCPHCKRAKAWMNGNGVAYEERNIESSAEYAQENRRINPRGSIPTFDVDGDVMTGFAENDLAALILRAARKRSASPGGG